MMNPSSPVLVTGATGFIGAAVTRALLRRGYQVRVLVRPGARLDNLAGLDVETALGDLRAPATLAPAVSGCRGLIHAAADYRLGARDPDTLYRTNVDGTVALLRAAAEAGVGRIVYTSSVATLAPRPDGEPADEEDLASLAQMIGHYKRSKWLAERRVLALADQGLPATLVCPTAPLGPGDVKPTPTGRIVLDALRGRMPAYVNTGLNVVHVDDVAEGHVLALVRGTPGRRYILGGDDMTLKTLLEAVCRQGGRRPPRVRLPLAVATGIAALSELTARIGRSPPAISLESVRLARHRMFFSSARARRELGYRGRPAANAIADAVAWFARAEAGPTPEANEAVT